MLVGLYIGVFVFLLFVPVFIPITFSFIRKLDGNGKAVFLWVIFTVCYYVILFKGVGAFLDTFYPLEIHKENVCEIKTTYSRKGLF